MTSTHPPRTVIITGAGAGLGRAFAHAFAARGDRVVVADIDSAAAHKVAAELDGAVAVEVDVRDTASTDALATTAAEVGGGQIDVVINNAAIYATLTRSSLEAIAEPEWDRVMAVNVKGPWQVVRACSPHLSEGARIINISSATVMSGSAQWAHYVASKAAVIGLTRVMATELGPRGITVNAVAPGFTLTEASHGLIEGAETYGVERSALRRPIQPDDIVGTVLFLADDASRSVTGQTVVVDGGRQYL